MPRRVALIVAIVGMAIMAGFTISGATDAVPDSKALTVHEWGTFTSVAGKTGEAVAWLPVENPSAQSDLPCFVNQSPPGLKAILAGTVRMETPVLYFYAPREMKINATVRFS